MAVAIAACGGDDEATPTTTSAPATTIPATTTTVVELRSLLVERVIPAHQRFADMARALEATADESCPDDLAPVQQAFRDTRLAWDRARVYPVAAHLRERLPSAVDWWPVDEEGIDELVAGDEPMSADDIEALGSKLRGLYAIEHVLFGADPPTARGCSFVAGGAGAIAAKTDTVIAALRDAELTLPDALVALSEGLYRVCDEDLGMPSGARFGLSDPDVRLIRQGGAEMALVDIQTQIDESQAAYDAVVIPLLAERFPGEEDPLANLWDQAQLTVEQIGDDYVRAIEVFPEFVVGAANACRDLRRGIITTLAGVLGVTLVLPVGDGD